MNNLNLGDVDTDIDTNFYRWLAKIESQKPPSWVDRFIETFMMYFPPEQIHIIDGENMAHNAQEGNTIGGTTLDCIIWSLVDTHLSATSGFGFDHIRVQHVYMI